jgi:hypothetical protein
MAARGGLGKNSYPLLHFFYSPLLYLQDHSEMMEKASEWYQLQFAPVADRPLTEHVVDP